MRKHRLARALDEEEQQVVKTTDRQVLDKRTGTIGVVQMSLTGLINLEKDVKC